MRLLLAAILFLATALAAQAERRVALVFGTDRYAQLRPLHNARSDADLIARTLEALDFEVTQEPDRDLRRMRRALDDLRDGGPADVALVYFAGHGVEVSGSNRLLPTDADLASLATLEASSLPLDEIRAAAAEIAPVVLILIDACRNDPFGSGSGEGRGAFTFGEDVRPGFGRMGEAQNTLFAFAAAPGATAADGEGANSPFTTALAKYLGTEGIEVRSALTLVQQEVYDLTRGAQQPYVESGLPRLFFAAATPGELPERERLLLAMAGLTPALRAEVEAAAARHGVPLAPLYGALIGADLASLSTPERAARLDEAASAFLATSAALGSLEASDPQVAALRQTAEGRLALGDFGGAAGYLDQAAELDRQAGTALETRLAGRRLSEAATLRLKAGVLRTALDHAGAAAALEQAAQVHASIESLDLDQDARAERDDLLWELGELYALTGQSDRARDAFARMGQAALLYYQTSNGAPLAYHDIGQSWRLTGDALVTQGDLTGALQAYDAALRIQETLARNFPDHAGSQTDLADTLASIGYTLRTTGNLPGALDAFGRAVEIRKALTRDHPDDTALLRNLVITQSARADMLREAGDLSGALALYLEANRVAEDIANAQPGNPAPKYDLALTRQRIGDIALDTGDGKTALGWQRASGQLIAELLASDPGNATYQSATLYAHLKTGNALAYLNRLAEAQAEFQSGLDIARRLAALDRSNAEWQRDLTLALSHMGDTLRRLDRPAEAERAFLEVQRILTELLARDPGNTDWRRDYGNNLSVLGTVRKDLGDPAGALAYFRAYFQTIGQLIALNPDNPLWRSDYAIAHLRLAQQGEAPRQNLTAAKAILDDLRARGQLVGSDQWIVEQVNQLLASTR